MQKLQAEGKHLIRRTWSRGGAAPPLPEQSRQEPSVDTDALLSIFQGAGQLWEGLGSQGCWVREFPKAGVGAGLCGAPSHTKACLQIVQKRLTLRVS